MVANPQRLRGRAFHALMDAEREAEKLERELHGCTFRPMIKKNNSTRTRRATYPTSTSEKQTIQKSIPLAKSIPLESTTKKSSAEGRTIKKTIPLAKTIPLESTTKKSTAHGRTIKKTIPLAKSTSQSEKSELDDNKTDSAVVAVASIDWKSIALQLNKRLLASEAKILAQEYEATDSTKQLEELKATHAAFSRATSEHINQLHNQISHSNEVIELELRSNTELQGKLEVANEEIKTLRMQLSQAEAQLKTHNATTHQQTAKDEISSLKAHMDMLHQRIDTQDAANQHLTQTNQGLLETLENERGSMATMDKKNKDLLMKVKELEQVTDSLLTKHFDMLDALEDKEVEVNRLQETIDLISEDHSDKQLLQDENAILREELTLLEQELRATIQYNNLDEEESKDNRL